MKQLLPKIMMILNISQGEVDDNCLQFINFKIYFFEKIVFSIFQNNLLILAFTIFNF